MFSGLVAAGLAFGLQLLYGPRLSPLPRLVLGVALVFSGYLGMLLYVMGQKAFFLDLLRGLRTRSPLENEIAVSA